MTKLNQNKSNSSKEPNPNGSYTPIKNLYTPSSFQVENNLKQLTNTQEAFQRKRINQRTTNFKKKNLASKPQLKIDYKINKFLEETTQAFF